LKIEKRPENIKDEQLKTSDDKKSIVPSNVINFTVSHKATLQTSHKLAINSCAVIDFSTFATSANESKIKIWGFT
jgi:hypothetical protein